MSQTLPVTCPNNPLPRELDLTVSISRPQTEIATDMTLQCFLTPSADFAPNNGRVRYYSSFAALAADSAMDSAMYRAGSAFFSQQNRPATFAVARVFDEPVSAGLIAGNVNLEALALVTAGALDIEIDGSLVSLSGLDFSGASKLADLAEVLDAVLETKGARAEARYGGLHIRTVSAGSQARLDYAAAPASGTDVSGLLGLTQEAGAQLWQGYAPEGLAAEAAMAQTASRCNGSPIYAWSLDAVYRDTPEQKSFADWIEPQAPAVTCLTSNSVAAMNSQDTTNIVYYILNLGYIRSAAFYHSNPQAYPDVAYLAMFQAVNYGLPDSAITGKFKTLEGIEPVQLTETQLTGLTGRRVNTYTAIGNNARTVREGVQAAATWYTDTVVNLDNFREELQVEVYNVFLRNKKVPYSTRGQNLLVSAAAKICAKYVRNGVFADRDIEDPTSESGVTNAPAYNIVPTPIAFATASERASRLAPPIQITVYETGAIHAQHISVDVVN